MNSSKKIYQENSYLTDLKAKVLSCNKTNDTYEVILDNTIFYPHMSGGQPKDEGTLNGLKVLNVIENNDEIIHYISEPVSGIVNLSVDFVTRFDYMQQHTGQHILSCAFDDLYNAKTVGFHLSSDYTTIDLDISLTEDMIKNAELYANSIIYENPAVTARTLPYDEAISLNLRKPPLKLDYLRIIEIQDRDLIACSGTHVKSAGEVGIIKIVKLEKYKTGTRLEFLCGKRALKDYILKNDDINKLSALLTCRSDMIYDNLDKIKTENKDLKRNIINLKNKINDYIVKDLKESAEIINDIHFVFQQLDDVDPKDLRFISSKAVEDKNFIAVLISESDGLCSVCLAQSENLNYDLKYIFESCKVILNLKGGGNNRLMQGTGDILDKNNECLKTAKELLIK